MRISITLQIKTLSSSVPDFLTKLTERGAVEKPFKMKRKKRKKISYIVRNFINNLIVHLETQYKQEEFEAMNMESLNLFGVPIGAEEQK